MTSLHRAAENGYTQVVEVLLQSQANVNATNDVRNYNAFVWYN